MKLTGVKAKSYLTTPDNSVRAVLLFGADAMRIAIKRKELCDKLVGKDAQDDMRLTRFPAAEVRKDPAIVMDALTAQSFFPGPRAVVVEDAADGLTKTLAMCLEEITEEDAYLIVTAGNLAARSKLRSAFEKDARAYSIGIYDDPISRDEVLSKARTAGLNDLNKSAIDALVSLGQELDPGEFDQTIEKVALFSASVEGALDLEDISPALPTTTDADLDDAINAVADGKSSDIGPILKRLFGQGVSPTALCIAANRHFKTLYSASCDSGGPESGIAGARPPIYGPRRDRMIRQTRAWGNSRLKRVLSLLIDTDLLLRSSQKAPQNALVERAFIRIAMMRPR